MDDKGLLFCIFRGNNLKLYFILIAGACLSCGKLTTSCEQCQPYELKKILKCVFCKSSKIKILSIEKTFTGPVYKRLIN